MSKDEYFGKWLTVIDFQLLSNLLRILNPMYEKKKIMPAYKDIFKAFHICPYDKLKVIFIGQDPYPQEGVATGILFGNKEGTQELSPSLQVIKEACVDYSVPHSNVIFDVTLESWAGQGILMLNSALTVEVGKVGSHTMLWRPFISKLLTNLSNKETGLVYVLFGTQAQTLEPYINKKFNDVLKIHHPAYYARENIDMPHKLFTDINALVEGRYGESIKWYFET